MKSFFLCAMLFVSTAVLADEVDVGTSGQEWSIVTGKTVGNHRLAVEGGIGWPGMHAGILYGSTSRFDIGGRLTFNYGDDGIVTVGPYGTVVVTGLKFQAPMRFLLADNGKVNFGLHFDPGFGLYFPYGYVNAGLLLPVGIVLGIPVSSAVHLGLTFDVPFALYFPSHFGASHLILPLLMGVGVEYFIQTNLLVYFSVKMGPAINTLIAARAYFDLESQVGIGYRF